MIRLPWRKRSPKPTRYVARVPAEARVGDLLVAVTNADSMRVPPGWTVVNATQAYRRIDAQEPASYVFDTDGAVAVIPVRVMPSVRRHIADEVRSALCVGYDCEDRCAARAEVVDVILEGFEV